MRTKYHWAAFTPNGSAMVCLTRYLGILWWGRESTEIHINTSGKKCDKESGKESFFIHWRTDQGEALHQMECWDLNVYWEDQYAAGTVIKTREPEHFGWNQKEDEVVK